MPNRKLLCIADGSLECRSAVVFGAQRAHLTNSELIILRIIEPIDNSLWGLMGDAAREELRQEALLDLQNLSEIAKQAGITPNTIIREGEAHAQIREQIDQDEGIKSLLLASSGGKNGPGPLVTAATRGSIAFGKRAVAIMIIPDGLDDAAIRDLAS